MKVPQRARSAPKGSTGNVIKHRLRHARRLHEPRLSQDALSGRLAARGVTIGRAGIAKIEAGRRGVSDFEIVALSQSLGVTVNWLLGVK